jgi:hypothetical protein
VTAGPLARGPGEGDTFVAGAYERFWNPPPFQLVLNETMADGSSQAYLYYWDGQVLRTHSGGWQIIDGPDFSASREQLEGHAVWVVRKHEPSIPFGQLIIFPARPNCITGWEQIEVVDVIGRKTRHVRCASTLRNGQRFDLDFWIDVASGLPLRTTSTTYRSSTSATGFVEHEVQVTELTFGPQDPDLFVPSGETISGEAFDCATGVECATPRPLATPRSSVPIVTPPPAPNGEPPADLTAYVAEVRTGYESGPPVDILINPAPASISIREWRRDGLGSFRYELDHDPLDEYGPVSWIVTGGRAYEWDPRSDADWRVWDKTPHPPELPTFDLPAGCGLGWSYRGDDLVLGRPAAHLACGFQEFWIDREWKLVTRAHDHDPAFGDDPGAGLSQVIAVTFGPQPAELFASPAPDNVWR